MERFFYTPSDPYLREVLGETQLRGREWWWRFRLGVALVALGWLAATASSLTGLGGQVLLLIAFSALTGGVGWWERQTALPWWALHGLVAVDALVVTSGVMLHAVASQSPPIHGFGLSLALLASVALAFTPQVMATFGLALVATWTLGYGMAWIAGADWPITTWLAQIALMMLAGGALVLAQSVLLFRLCDQIGAEREYYEGMLAEREVTAREEPEEDDLREYTDRLTGLGTRAAFERDSTLFTKVFTEGRLPDLTIAFISVEDFQHRFDEYGPRKYGQMIRVFAQAAREQFRNSDMVYRLNNYQFALLAPGASLRNADRLESLLQDILAKVHAAGFPEVTASMGLSTLDEASKAA